MVEAALTMVLFLMLLFGIMEFAMLIFRVSSLVEATRAGARYLIVNDPVPAVDFGSIDCSDEDNNSATATCDAGCDGLVPLMQSLYGQSLDDSQVQVQYRCSITAGYEGAYFNIYEVEVSVRNAEYRFVTPGILGLNATVTLPDFATSRLSEDLNTIP
jgi:hypothetical protein